ncbi:MAG TPA: L,D-transpeptidase family protein [Thermoanaerobacterales bacterium]|nr:L,D-transpeptidase family protein [Thermoanaerobacterales bacterium]
MRKKHYYVLAVIVILMIYFAFSRLSIVRIQELDDCGLVKITVNFLIPMKQDELDKKVRLISERPGTSFIKNCNWVNSKTLEIYAMEKGLPKGVNTIVHIGPLRTFLPGVYKSLKTNYKANIKSFLTGMSSIVPRTGPIILDFSTPINKRVLTEGIITDFEYDLKPDYIITENGKLFQDYSRWQLIPKLPLKAGADYEIKMNGYLSFCRTFRVADVPLVTSTSPKDSEKDVKLYEQIIIYFDEEMQEVDIEVKDMMGDVKIEEKTAIFKPYSAFIPGKTYNISVTGKSIYKEKLEPYNFTFTTVDMDDKWWVEINLKPVQRLIVYKGRNVIKSMVISGGAEGLENQTPLGFFSLKDRGEYFWAEKIQEGAFYWVRITDNYLIHSIPRDKDNKIIQEDFNKLGIPASHGCIRLKDEYAKWFYENVPSGTLVVIHD